MLNTLKNLVLALLNATLILIAVSLFLLWKVTQTADAIVTGFAQELAIVAPLRDDLQAATAELAALRGDLETLGARSGGISSAALQRLQLRVDALGSDIAGARQSVQELARAPELLVDHAIETASREFSRRAMEIRGCGAPET